MFLAVCLLLFYLKVYVQNMKTFEPWNFLAVQVYIYMYPPW